MITSKLIGSLTALPFLAGIAVFGCIRIWGSSEQATAVALFVFGVVALTELIQEKKQAKFLKMYQDFEAIRVNDTKTFLQFTDRVFGHGTLGELDTKDIPVDGLVFRHATTLKPSPFSSLAGPLCPKCGKNVSFAPARFGGMLYSCLCGFKKTAKKDPYSLYMEVRRHLNLPF